MKKLVLSLVLLAGMAAGMYAQDTKAGSKTTATKNATPEERAKRGSEKAAKTLGLSTDQQGKWEAAALERIKANAPVHEKLKGSTTPEERKALHEQAKANNQKFDAAVTAFLNADQKAKYEQKKEERRKKMKERHKGKSEQEILDDED
jgi:hypothetical protein